MDRWQGHTEEAWSSPWRLLEFQGCNHSQCGEKSFHSRCAWLSRCLPHKRPHQGQSLQCKLIIQRPVQATLKDCAWLCHRPLLAYPHPRARIPSSLDLLTHHVLDTRHRLQTLRRGRPLLRSLPPEQLAVDCTKCK